METRAAYMIVGMIVLAFTAAILGFTIWIAKVDLEADYDDYDIYFSESVAGLPNRGPVFYQGIPVGEVVEIDLLDSDASKVHVWIRVRAEVPVTEETIATLQFQGLTGVAFIELMGGSPGAPRLLPAPGRERALIPSEASAFFELFTNTPRLLAQAIEVMGQIKKVLDDDNLAQIAGTLKNVNTITANMADSSKDLPAILTDMRTMVTQMTATTASLEELASAGTDFLKTDAAVLIKEAETTLVAAGQLMQRLDDLVAANEPNTTQFVNQSLPEITRMIGDLRKTARSLSRLVGRIEKNPGEVLFGGTEEEYDLQTRKKETKP